MNRPVDDRADAERDAWLRAALRHAPDAELGAPPALSAAILRQAGARATAGPGSAWQRLVDAWSWLARPPVAAGFASVMVATVVGLMWWDRPLEEALPRGSDTRAMVPTGTAPASIPDASVAVAPPASAMAEAAPAAEKAKVAAPQAQARPPAVEMRSAARARAADATAPAQAAQARRSARAGQAPTTQVAEPEAARKMAAPAPSAYAAAAPTPALEATRPAQGAAPPAAPPAAPAGLAAARLARPAASPAPSSFAAWRADILAQPQRWTWKLGTGTAQAMTPALQAWLASFDELVARATPLQEGSPEGNIMPLQLLRDGRLHTRLMVGDTGLWLLPAEAGRAPLSVALSPESAAALKAALDDALR